MKSLAAWMVLCCGAALAGQEASVLVSNTNSAPTAVVNCDNCSKCRRCNDGCCPVAYNESVDERSTCRRTIFGKVVKRDVKRTVLTPVR